MHRGGVLACGPSRCITAAGVGGETEDEVLVSLLSTAIVQVAKQAIPSVAHVEVTESREVANPLLPFADDPLFRRFFNVPQMPKKFKRETKGLGTGIIIDVQGHIVTNHHVAGGATKIEVVLSNGDRYPAKLVGTDPKTDLAVIKIEAEGLVHKSELGVIKLGLQNAAAVTGAFEELKGGLASHRLKGGVFCQSQIAGVEVFVGALTFVIDVVTSAINTFRSAMAPLQPVFDAVKNAVSLVFQELGKLGAMFGFTSSASGQAGGSLDALRSVAEFLGTEAALTYVSCWNANEGVIPAVVGTDGVVISDALA